MTSKHKILDPLASGSLQEVFLGFGHDIFTAPLAITPPKGQAQKQLHAPLVLHLWLLGV